MTHVPKSRVGRIEYIARIAVGRDPDDDNKPAKGWQSRLSRAMGMSPTAVHDTIKIANSEVFDRKLIRFAIDTRHRLERDIADLELYFEQLAAEQDAAAMGDDE